MSTGASQVATVVLRGDHKIKSVATTANETNAALLKRVNAVRVIKRINTNPGKPSRGRVIAATKGALRGAATTPLRTSHIQRQRQLELKRRLARAHARVVGPKGKLPNPTISGLRAELAEVDKDIADLETDSFYSETPGRRAYRAKWLAYHRRQRRKLEQLMRDLERAAVRRVNGIVEAAAGLQALEYIGGKAKRASLGRKPKFNPSRQDLWTARRRILIARTSEALDMAHRNYKQLLQEVGFSAGEAERTANEVIAQRRNPRAKGSRDALGVWHAENPLPAYLRFGGARAKKGVELERKAKRLLNESADLDHEANHETNAKKAAALRQKADRLWAQGIALEKRAKKAGEYTQGPVQKLPNPSVTALSEKFQGEADGSIDQLHAADGAPTNLARAGKLVFLKVKGRTFRIPGAMVAIAPNEKLWIVGKPPLFETKAKRDEGLDVGEVTHICYETAKAHIGNGKTFEYVHEFGEEGGKRPHLIIDHEGMPILRGGDYKIRAEGIIN